MSGSMNYAAVGEHTGYSEQARDAAGRRFAWLKNLAALANRAAERPGEPFEAAANKLLSDAVEADREMHAALLRANQAAALCGKRELRVDQLLHGKD